MSKEKAKTNNVPYAVEPNQPTTSGKTENYGLPQWEGSDITDWFELNPAFAKIDEAMHANEVSAQTAQTTADSNTASVGNLTESLNNTISRVTAAENVNNQQSQQITLNTTHLNEHDTAIQANTTAIAALQNEGSETGGDVAALQADVTALKGQMTTAQGNIMTNADHIGNLSDLQTTKKGNLVVAVNEIIGGSGTGEGATLADIGNLQDLNTTAKNNLVSAINELESLKPSGELDYYALALQTKTSNTPPGSAVVLRGILNATLRSTELSINYKRDNEDYIAINTAKGNLVKYFSVDAKAYAVAQSNFSPLGYIDLGWVYDTVYKRISLVNLGGNAPIKMNATFYTPSTPNTSQGQLGFNIVVGIPKGDTILSIHYGDNDITTSVLKEIM